MVDAGRLTLDTVAEEYPGGSGMFAVLDLWLGLVSRSRTQCGSGGVSEPMMIIGESNSA